MKLEGKKILVLGAAGKSGMAAASLYANLGAHVILSDKNAKKELPQVLSDQRRITDARPREDVGLLEGVDMVVSSPGLPLDLPVLTSAFEKKIPVYGEQDLASELICEHWKKKPIFIAVTGTDGKSTTTALIAHLISGCTSSDAIPCGNFGLPLSDLVLSYDERIQRKDSVPVLVVECSSFQLELTQFFHPSVAMILNLGEDHLDRYRDLDEYLEAKLRVLRNMDADDVLLAPASILAKTNASIRRQASEDLNFISNNRIVFHKEDICGIADFPLYGLHNQLNLNFSLAAIDAISDPSGSNRIDLDLKKLRSAIQSFRGLSHRMQRLGVWNHIEFINDSKATTVQAVCAGLESFQGKNAVLLAGGYDKGLSYAPLSKYKNTRLLAFGAAREKIMKDTGTAEGFENLETAFQYALSLAAKEKVDVIYLGPACASYDAYNSYEERGNHFEKLFQGLGNAKS